MEERMTLCNMVVEAGGKNGVVPADSTTYKYLEVNFRRDKLCDLMCCVCTITLRIHIIYKYRLWLKFALSLNLQTSLRDSIIYIIVLFSTF